MFVPNDMFCTQTVSLLSKRQIKASDFLISCVGRIVSVGANKAPVLVFRCARDPLAETATPG